MLGQSLHKALIPFAFLSILGGPDAASAQIDESRVDAELKERVGAAQSEIARYRRSGRTELEDSVHLDLAKHLFDEYLRRGDTESGKFAVHLSFLHWADADATAEAMQATSQIDIDSKAWSFIIRPLRTMMGSSEHYNSDDYLRLLQNLDGKLSDPRSQAAVSLELGEVAFQRRDTLKATEAYRKAVELDADSIIVDIALGHLYEIESLNIGELAPVFQTETISGERMSLEDLRGRVVLLEFWATWCGPCLPEIPYLKQAWSQFKDEDFALIGISWDANRDFLQQFVTDKGIQWPQVQETEGFRGEISELYNVSGIPRTYLIGREGRIIEKDFRKGEIIEVVRHALSTPTD